MSAISPQQYASALATGLNLHRAGDLQHAAAIYEQILRHAPAHADALHLLGLVAHQNDRQDAAADLIRKAILSNARNPAYHNSLGEVFRAQGHPAEARRSYQRALKLKPDYAEARCNLGVALQQEGKTAQAIECYRQALRLNPQLAAAHYNLGNALQVQGEFQSALESYNRCLDLRPDFADAHRNKGIVLHALGRLDSALQSFSEALRFDPASAEAHQASGRLLLQLGDRQAAVASLRQAVSLKPELAGAHGDLAEALTALGRHEEAVQCNLAALRVDPDSAEVYNSLGNSLFALDKLKTAREAYEQALRLQPDFAEAYYNLGNVLKREVDPVGARANYDHALRLDPHYAEAHLNKGGTYLEQGDFAAAIVEIENTLRLKPDHAEAHSNRLFALNYRPDCTPSAVFEVHRQWAEQQAAPLRRVNLSWKNDRDPERRLRIGYVSPDLQQHPVGFLLEGVLAVHDPSRFEVICYSDTTRPDDTTARLQALAGSWRDIRGYSDEALSKLIEEDGIDILVDLAGHTAHNRLLVFARKPAPVQVSWLGYFNTTGLDAIDYFISDQYSSPPGGAQAFSEQVVRLPGSRFCYRPPAYAPPVLASPVLASGQITFGSFNNLAKLNRQVIALWARVLHEVANARLVLKSKLLSDESTRQRYLELFREAGISPDRLDLRGSSSHAGMLKEYGEIDIALDPFPFTGGLTTLEALWMGVPVVTLAGETLVSRQSASFLTVMGQSALIANSEREYVEIAKSLAGDVIRLENLRGVLRPLMQDSPLCDKENFARNLEHAYRQMWRTWCEAEH